MKTKEEIVNNWLPRYTGKHIKIGIDALKEIKMDGSSVKHLRF